MNMEYSKINIVIKDYTEEEKMKYVADLCKQYKKPLYVGPVEIIHLFDRSEYENLCAFRYDSSMSMEDFTLGRQLGVDVDKVCHQECCGNYENEWISNHNNCFDVLIFDRTPGYKYENNCSKREFLDRLNVENWRNMWWKIKPLYIFDGQGIK